MGYNTVEENVMEKMFKSYTFNILLILVFTVSALYLTIRDFVDEILLALQSIDVGWLIVVILMALFYHVLIGIILTQLTRMSNPKYKYRQGIVNALIAAFFHGITPSASGGQFAQVYVFNKQKVALSDAASVLWLDFILGNIVDRRVYTHRCHGFIRFCGNDQCIYTHPRCQWRYRSDIHFNVYDDHGIYQCFSYHDHLATKQFLSDYDHRWNHICIV